MTLVIDLLYVPPGDEGQFVVLSFVGGQLLMPSSYHAGFAR